MYNQSLTEMKKKKITRNNLEFFEWSSLHLFSGQDQIANYGGGGGDNRRR
jgi:hypothetical protein